MPFRLLGAELQAPGGDGRAHAFGEAMMAGEDIVQAFREQHIERGAQAAQQLRRRRVGKIAVLVGADHVLEEKKQRMRPFGSCWRRAPSG